MKYIFGAEVRTTNREILDVLEVPGQAFYILRGSTKDAGEL
jgi:hypothetical protein